MQKLGGMSERAGYLLRLAAILHETGKFINMRKHRVCSYELIRRTDLFGLTDEEKEVVACVAAYVNMSATTDLSADIVERRLEPEIELLVSKLQAIFSLADALDKSHTGKITAIRAELQGEELIVHYERRLDISLERWMFAKVSVNFEEVFGVTPKLVKGQV